MGHTWFALDAFTENGGTFICDVSEEGDDAGAQFHSVIPIRICTVKDERGTYESVGSTESADAASFLSLMAETRSGTHSIMADSSPRLRVMPIDLSALNADTTIVEDEVESNCLTLTIIFVITEVTGVLSLTVSETEGSLSPRSLRASACTCK